MRGAEEAGSPPFPQMSTGSRELRKTETYPFTDTGPLVVELSP